MDHPTVEVYEARAADYDATRPPRAAHRARATAFAARALPGRPVADLGCGPGGYLGYLGSAVVGLDAASSMLGLARRRAPGAALVQGDLEALPFRSGALGGAWARNTYVHIAKAQIPLALAGLHRAMAVGAPLEITALTGDDEGPWRSDDLTATAEPGRADEGARRRFFSRWPPERFADVVAGAGFTVDDVDVIGDAAWVSARRARTLPDFVGPGMRLLICGLNPSLVAADAGFGYAGATNRFWAAALEAGIVSRARDPIHALVVDGVGMTDLVKRATPRADEVSPVEYRAGVERVERLVEWLRPGAVAFVGLAGWRAAVDRRAVAGRQPAPFGGVAAYVLPSTSGLNARTPRSELADHLRSAAAQALGGRGAAQHRPGI